MCALCGGLIGGRHWADTGGDARSHQSERRDRIRFLNKVLGHFEMEVRAWGSDGYLLTGRGMPSLLRRTFQCSGPGSKRCAVKGAPR